MKVIQETSYQRLEKMVTCAPDILTVAYLTACEAHGEPWPISGDATTVLAGKDYYKA